MKARLGVAVVTGLLMAGVGVGVSFGGPDEKANRHNAAGSEQAKQFAAIAGDDTRAAARVKPAAAKCKRGMAGAFPCDGIDMLSHVSREALGLSFVNDIWGWTDPRTRHHYALVGGTEGTVFVDITKPKRPDIVGTLPSHSLVGGRFWRDIKVFEDHAFIVSEHDQHEMQVFDLRGLRGVRGAPVTFDETALYEIDEGGGDTAAGNTHNLNINEDTGYAYLVGTSTCNSGLHMVDVNDPADPTFAGCFEGHGYIHDAQCVIYEGPDTAHRGQEICFNANAERTGPRPQDIENTLSIVDVTDKEAPVELARVFYGQDGYSHQGWLNVEQTAYIHGDELDEQLTRANTRTRAWDIRDLDAPQLAGVFTNETTSIDHNLYTEGGRSYHSNYTSGLRIYDISKVEQGELSEVGYFDLYPANDKATFEGGTWSNYPYYQGKKFVAVSSIDRGLFVLQPRPQVLKN
jgi:choice-of-anchor B domain-containing protein